MLYLVSSSLYILFNSKANVVTSLKSLSSGNKNVSLFLIADSISLNCS